MNTINLARGSLSGNLKIKSIVMSMFDGRNNLNLEVVEEVRKYFKDKVFMTMIPCNIRLAEAPSYGMSASSYDKNSKRSIAYKRLAEEFL